MTNKALILLAALALTSCGKTTAPQQEEEINDSTSPLHLLKPDYKTPYGELDTDSVKADVDRVFAYVYAVTPARVVNEAGEEITDYTNLPDDAKLNQGTYRLTSYEWGVMYSALLEASKNLNDPKYRDYALSRIKFLNEVAPAFKAQGERLGKYDAQMRQVVAPAALDDAGAMCAAWMTAAMADSTIKADTIIEGYWKILQDNYRLADGTIARTRPHHNTVWLDDMFMALPTMATRGHYANDPKQFDEAAKMASQIIDRMWVPEKKLFRHGYVEGLEQQPTFHWGRANGWAILTMCRLLDLLPENHPGRAKIMSTFKEHVKGLVATQSKDGFWHQLLDRNDSYEETSATAIFTYCLAHAINEGWIDAVTYGPVAQLGWEAVSTKINDKGEVEDVCVGTGMGFDPAFYYYRPVSVKAAHGYGPVIWAGSEMVRLLNKYYPRSNDSGIHYYNVDPENTTPLFYLDENGKATEVLH